MTAKSEMTNNKTSLESLLWQGIEYDEHEETLRNKREDAGIELCGLLNQTGVSRAELARRLNWKPSRITRALSGNENLTLNTLTTLINALGMDYDLVFRKQGTHRHFQPWEHEYIQADILQMHGHARAILQTSLEINRAMFRKSHTSKPATRLAKTLYDATFNTFTVTYQEENHASCAR